MTDRDELRKMIDRHGLDGVLGHLASICRDYAAEGDFHDPIWARSAWVLNDALIAILDEEDGAP